VVCQKLEAAAGLEGSLSVEGVHKKINMSDPRVRGGSQIKVLQCFLHPAFACVDVLHGCLFMSPGSSGEQWRAWATSCNKGVSCL